MKKILSIAIAAYNVEKTIEETLEPFLKCRELDKMEVIIVNDGSKDKTPFVVKKYIDQFPNILSNWTAMIIIIHEIWTCWFINWKNKMLI